MAQDSENNFVDLQKNEESVADGVNQIDNESKGNPSKSEISDIMQDIRTAVLDEAEDRKVMEMSASKRSAFLLTKDMQVSPGEGGVESLPVTVQELKILIRRIVHEEINKI